MRRWGLESPVRYLLMDTVARRVAVDNRPRRRRILTHARLTARSRLDSGPLLQRPESIVTEAKQLGAEGQDGLNRLYRQYAAWLGRRLRARIGADAAADVVQETYIRAAPYVLSDIRHPKAFLLTIAENLLRDEGRRMSRQRCGSEGLNAPQSEAASQFDQALLSEVIRSMPVLYRNVFVLNRFGGMTYPEIARTLGVSVKTVEWRMGRAIEYCASRLDL